MTSDIGLSRFQIEVAQLFFRLPAPHGYAVAGGAGLIANELINRPTHDLDLFAHAPTRTAKRATSQFLAAAAKMGWTATVRVATSTFCRVHVIGRDDEVLVDLAIASPPTDPPTLTLLGPTLVPLDLAGRKLLALFGRAEARDFADVFLLAGRFGKQTLLRQASLTDSGFDPVILAEMLATLERFVDDEIPLPPQHPGTNRAPQPARGQRLFDLRRIRIYHQHRVPPSTKRRPSRLCEKKGRAVALSTASSQS